MQLHVTLNSRESSPVSRYAELIAEWNSFEGHPLNEQTCEMMEHVVREAAYLRKNMLPESIPVYEVKNYDFSKTPYNRISFY